MKRHKIFLSIFIFAVIFLVLGLPFTQWGFLHDDFGVIWHSTINNWHDFIALFSEPGMTTVVQPSNYVMPEQSFFAILYRPLTYCIHALQWKFFGFKAYGYFLTTIFFHAINTVIIFNIFLLFMQCWQAFLAAMLFGFHISHWDWLGWIAGQLHVINLTFILGILLLLKKYLDGKQILFYIASCLLFCISLFTRETALILPFWLPVALYFYQSAQKRVALSWSWLRSAVSITLGYFAVALFYFAIRAYFYPLKASGDGLKVAASPLKFLLDLRYRFFDLVTFAADLANLSWLGGGNRMFKGILIAFFFSVVIWLFYKNTKKSLLFFCLFSMVTFMWPAVLRYYSSRYLYKALPFWIMFLFFLIRFYPGSKARCKAIGYCVLGIMLACNMILLPLHFKQRERVLHKTELAFDQLAHDKRIIGRTLCFVGLPYDIFPTGVAQAVWMHGANRDLPIYYDNSTFVWSNKPIDKNMISITPIQDGLQLQSLDKKVWFSPNNKFTLMGTITCHQRDKATGGFFDMSYVFDKKWLTQNLLFVTWDYEQHRFILLE